jgi:prepilin-type processing-associated H-X9-DG protein
MLELMIVVSIIAVLIALLLPAVQSARETARRAQCANNLIQLGIAMGSYVSTHSVLPPGVVNATGPIRNLPEGYHHGWVVQILPFIGQKNIYNHFDKHESVYDPANDTVAGMKIATLLCPSDPRRGVISFAGCHHDLDEPIASTNHGVLYLNSKVRYDEMTDGTAYTILLGEIRGGGPSLGWASGTRSTLRNTGIRINQTEPLLPPVPAKPLRTTRTPRDEELALVEEAVEDGSWPVDLTGGFASYHAGMCNFLFCDGSVRPVKNGIPERIYRLLGHRADGEMIDGEAY